MRKRINIAITACTLLLTSCAPAQDQADDSSSKNQTTTTATTYGAAPGTAPGELSGVSSSEVAPAAATSATEDSPSAFHFASGTLPIGDFDPLEVHPNVFNPCEEISAEEFARVGFEVIGEPVWDHSGSRVSCQLGLLSGITNYSILIEGSLATADDIKAQGEFHDSVRTGDLANVILFSTVRDPHATCRAAISTQRGMLVVSVNTPLDQDSRSQNCDRAAISIDNIYLVTN